MYWAVVLQDLTVLFFSHVNRTCCTIDIGVVASMFSGVAFPGFPKGKRKHPIFIWVSLHLQLIFHTLFLEGAVVRAK